MFHHNLFSFRRPGTLGTAAAMLLICSATAAQAQPRLAKDAEVQPCRLLGRVSGDSGYGKNNDWKGAAKQAALQRAERLGASDIVVDRYAPVGSFNGLVEARAYLCGASPVKTVEIGNGEPARARN